MNIKTYYLVKREYDELNKRVSGSRLRTDGPIRVNSIGWYDIDHGVLMRGMIRKDYYLMYIVKGCLCYGLEGREVMLTAGDFILYPPFYPVHYRIDAGKELEYYLIHFSGTDADRFVSSLRFSSMPAIGTVGIVDEVCDEFNRLFDCCARGADMLQEIVGTGTQSILLSLVAHTGGSVHMPAPQNAVLYINRKYSEKIRVSELARLENMSESRFYTVFKSAMGKSPVDYIIDKRIEVACTLLSSMTASIEQIGRTVGFQDTQFFSKQFKSRMGMSPLQYRKSLGGG